MICDFMLLMMLILNCVDLYDSCVEFDLVYGICKVMFYDSFLLYK